MPEYVKRPDPVRIEPMTNPTVARALMDEVSALYGVEAVVVDEAHATIPTLESGGSDHHGLIGPGPDRHSVAFGANGDPYFIRNDILAKTYQPASEAPSPHADVAARWALKVLGEFPTPISDLNPPDEVLRLLGWDDDEISEWRS